MCHCHHWTSDQVFSILQQWVQTHEVWYVLSFGHTDSFTDVLSALDQEAVCSSL